MWCRKALAVASIVTRSPLRSTRSAYRRRTGERAWHSTARKALKSCSPTSSAAAAAMGSIARGRWMSVTRCAASAERARRLRTR